MSMWGLPALQRGLRRSCSLPIPLERSAITSSPCRLPTCRSGRYGSQCFVSACRSISISPAIPTWRSEWRAMFGFRFPGKFQLSVLSPVDQRFLAALAHHAVGLVSRLCLCAAGGSRGSTWSTTRNLWIVFLLCGAWHGASWNFVVWGMWHGLFLSIERLAPVEARSGSPRVAAQRLHAARRHGGLGFFSPADPRSRARHARALVRDSRRERRRCCQSPRTSPADHAADRDSGFLLVSYLAACCAIACPEVSARLASK